MSVLEAVRTINDYLSRGIHGFIHTLDPAAAHERGNCHRTGHIHRQSGGNGRRTAVLCAAMVAAVAVTVGRVDAAGRTVRVGVYQNEPKIFMDAAGRASGIYIDLLNKIAPDEGWTLVYVPCQWADCLSALESGQIDLMPDVAYSMDRAQIYDFNTTPVLTSWSQVYANPRMTINGYEDLVGKRVAVLDGSIQQTVFGQYMSGFGFKVTIVATSSLEDAFRLAANGSVDAAIANNFFGDYFYKQYGLTKTPIVFLPSTLFYATAKGRNADLLEVIDRHLNAWLQEPNSTYYTTLNHWTEEVPAPVFHVPQFIYWVIGIIGGLFILALAMVLLLREQVLARTRHLEQANQALRESETRYQLISTAASDYMFSSLLDAKGKFTFTWVAGAFEAITGYTLDEYVAHGGWRAAIHPDDLAVYDGDVDKLRANQPVISEIRTLAKNGETVWVRVYAHPILDSAHKELMSIYGAVQDISERKQAEIALKDKMEDLRRLATVVSDSNDAVILHDFEGKILAWNRGAKETYGYTETEALGKNVREIVTDADREAALTLIQRIQQGDIVKSFELRRVTKDGRILDVWLTTTLLTDEKGKPVAIATTERDITKRKQAEEEVRELNRTLEQRVTERTAELVVAKDRAEEADRLKSAFLATMSHELRTPLNSIIGFTGILLQELAGPLNAEQRKQLEMVRDSGRHLLALINDVLDISKIEAGQLEVRSEPFDLRALIEKVAGIVRPLAVKKSLDLHVELAPDIGTFVSDARRVEQVLLNLLNNAIKFTERGTVTLTAEIAPGALSAPNSLPAPQNPAARQAGVLRISVADTGIGIKPEDFNKLFLPFRQIDSSLTRQHEGTGLGLAICRRLADLLGGEIHATSEWGKGSVFTFTLPMKGRENP